MEYQNSNAKTLVYVGLLAVLLTGGIGAAQEVVDDSARKFTAPEIKAALEAVGMELNDPYSAKFSRLFRGINPRVVCGYVNGKNLYGAYVGNTLFYYDGGNNKATIVQDESKAVLDFYKTLSRIMCNLPE